VSQGDELVAAAALALAEPGEELAGVLAAEPASGRRVFVCAYRSADALSWLALDVDGSPIFDRQLVHDAVTLVGLCEVAEEAAGGGDVAQLRRALADLRERENPEGIEEAEAAAEALERTLLPPPRVASVVYLDAIGSAVSRLERALGEVGSSPFAKAMSAGSGAVEELAREVVGNYKRPFEE
jgi:hypothetical protein